MLDYGKSKDVMFSSFGNGISSIQHFLYGSVSHGVHTLSPNMLAFASHTERLFRSCGRWCRGSTFVLGTGRLVMSKEPSRLEERIQRRQNYGGLSRRRRWLEIGLAQFYWLLCRPRDGRSPESL